MVSLKSEALPLLSLGWYLMISMKLHGPRKEFQGTYSHGGPSEFIHATMTYQLIELPSIGGKFTWSNNSIGYASKQNKLNRNFTNLHWIDLWPNSRLEYCRGNTSDHATMIITFSNIESGSNLSESMTHGLKILISLS